MDRGHTEQEAARLADVWIAAERGGDVAFLDRTLADDFVAVGPLGFTLTKKAWIGRHQSGNFRYDSLDWDEATVRLYNGAAVVIGRQTQDAVVGGNSVKGQLRTTVMLVHQGGQWQLAGVHMSPIGQPPSFARP